MDKYLSANIIFSKFSRDYMDLIKELPIRPSEMGLLNIIVKREGLFTPAKIAELLEVSKPMVTSHIVVLEKKGYITKQFLEDDKRSFFVIATDKARELVKVTSEKTNNKLKDIENFLGQDDFKTLIRLLEKTNQRLKENL